MIEPYYVDEWVTLYHADCMDVLPTFAPRSFDLVLTDPPYGSATHANALTLRTKGTTGETGWDHGVKPNGRRVQDVDRTLLDFDFIPFDVLLSIFHHIGNTAKRWIISFMEWRYMLPLEQWCEEESNPLRFIRHGVYCKTNGAPQVSGDRPAHGWESIAMLHCKNNGRMFWNGGGHPAVYIGNKPYNARHPTEKPEWLIKKLLTQFSLPGDIVLDPFAGSGTTGVACKQLRRRCVLIEQDADYCAMAAKRLQATQPMMEFDAPPVAVQEGLL